MTDAEILEAIDKRLGRLPGTRSPELHRMLGAMVAVIRRLEGRLQALEPERNLPPEPIVAPVLRLLDPAGLPSDRPHRRQRDLTAATRARSRRERELP